MNLGNIFSIDISYNKIMYISQGTFYNISFIYILKLNNNPLTQIDLVMFSSIHLKYVVSNEFHICCVVPANTCCSAPLPWYASCSNLLPNLAVKLLFMIISLIILVANGISFLTNTAIIIKGETGKVFSIIVCCVNLGDIMCGSYLTILWIGDIYFGNIFSIKDYFWTHSMPCFLAFMFLLTFSSIMPYLLSISSLARLMVVAYPLQSRFKSSRFVYKLVLGGMLPIIFLCSGIVMHLKLKNKRLTNLCSPFIDTTDSVLEIEIITMIVVFIQVVAFSFISVIYVLLINLLMEHRRQMQSLAKSKVANIMAQLILVTASNLLAWFPSSIIFVSSLFLPKYPTNLLVWTTSTIVPINSIIIQLSLYP